MYVKSYLLLVLTVDMQFKFNTYIQALTCRIKNKGIKIGDTVSFGHECSTRSNELISRHRINGTFQSIGAFMWDWGGVRERSRTSPEVTPACLLYENTAAPPGLSSHWSQIWKRKSVANRNSSASLGLPHTLQHARPSPCLFCMFIATNLPKFVLFIQLISHSRLHFLFIWFHLHWQCAWEVSLFSQRQQQQQQLCRLHLH